MAVLVAADFCDREWAQWWPLLRAALPSEQLVRERHEVPAHVIDIALVANPPAGSLGGLPGLRLIQSLWAGVERLLADASVPAYVPLARMVDPLMSDAMAQTALWAVHSLHRGFFGYAMQQRAGVWQANGLLRADEVTVAVLGLGQMGRAAARAIAKQGYRVLGWSRSAGRADEVCDKVLAFAGDAALPQVLAQSHIVINLLPLTPATRGLFNAATLAQLPRGASLVNLARGAHVVEAELLAALASGQLRHAVLDVFAAEPLPPGHAFWSHPSVTVLPHVAAPTDPRSAVRIAASNVRALRNGLQLANLVDRTRGY
ncbi:MAG: glyoxylate/hydroxypyruvate reductase A [Rhizobacter sp.]|nr:glyoxylate/hydroxypyruvate reductase A [Rhizobacter sp.]